MRLSFEIKEVGRPGARWPSVAIRSEMFSSQKQPADWRSFEQAVEEVARMCCSPHDKIRWMSVKGEIESLIRENSYQVSEG